MGLRVTLLSLEVGVRPPQGPAPEAVPPSPSASGTDQRRLASRLKLPRVAHPSTMDQRREMASGGQAEPGARVWQLPGVRLLAPGLAGPTQAVWGRDVPAEGGRPGVLSSRLGLSLAAAGPSRCWPWAGRSEGWLEPCLRPSSLRAATTPEKRSSTATENCCCSPRKADSIIITTRCRSARRSAWEAMGSWRVLWASCTSTNIWFLTDAEATPTDRATPSHASATSRTSPGPASSPHDCARHWESRQAVPHTVFKDWR